MPLLAYAIRVSTLAGPFAGTPLIWTKIDPPVARERVSRDPLLDILRQRPAPRLALIRAPAGWGKSTLLADWYFSEGEDRAFAWLALDRLDNDPTRFWRYAIETLRTIVADIGGTSLNVLSVPGGNLVDDVLPPLINELTNLPAETVLVLDDYHLIRNDEIHEQIAFLVEHLPSAHSLVVASRTEPPLPLARLRGRGELVEIDTEHLSFSSEEARALLNDVHGLALSAEDASRLRERTEGWPAGLYLAALSIRDRSDRGAFIEDFAGDDRHVVDYLSAEVLAGQPSDVREFLLRTSILERLSASACDAVMGRNDSARLLEEISRSNFFLIPLDTRREWYRYHHLFGELLRHELALAEPELVPALHRQAAEWAKNAGFVSTAVHHATTAGDVDEAAELIAEHWNTFLNQGRLGTVVDWLDTLPDTAVLSDPRLCLARAGTLLTLGRYSELDQWLDAAEHAEGTSGSRVGAASVEAETAIYRAVRHYRVGELVKAIEEARKAVELEQNDPSPWQAMAFAALGRSLYWRGEIEEASVALERAAELAEPGQNTLSILGVLGYLAVIKVERGELAEATHYVDVAIRLSEEHGFSEHWVTMMVHAASAKVLSGREELSGAVSAAQRAVELGRRGASRVETAYCLLVLAEAQARVGEPRAASTAFQDAREIVDGLHEGGILVELLQASAQREGHPAQSAASFRPDLLTDRELAVLRLLPSKLSQREIGAELYVSYNTVKTHTKRIFRKLGVSTRAEAVERARELDLL